MDNLRHNLLYVYNHCPEIVLESREIRMILNGKYKDIVDEYREEQIKFSTVSISDRPEDENIIIEEKPKLVTITDQPDNVQTSGKSKSRRKKSRTNKDK